MPEDVTVSTYEKLLLTEVSGVFLKDEEVWEDIGTQLNVVPFNPKIIALRFIIIYILGRYQEFFPRIELIKPENL